MSSLKNEYFNSRLRDLSIENDSSAASRELLAIREIATFKSLFESRALILNWTVPHF